MQVGESDFGDAAMVPAKFAPGSAEATILGLCSRSYQRPNNNGGDAVRAQGLALRRLRDAVPMRQRLQLGQNDITKAENAARTG